MTIFKSSPAPARLEKQQPRRIRIEYFVKMNFHWIILGMGVMLITILFLLAYLVIGPVESGIYYNHLGGM